MLLANSMLGYGRGSNQSGATDLGLGYSHQPSHGSGQVHIHSSRRGHMLQMGSSQADVTRSMQIEEVSSLRSTFFYASGSFDTEIAIALVVLGSRMPRNNAKCTKGDAVFRIFRAVSCTSWSKSLPPLNGNIHNNCPTSSRFVEFLILSLYPSYLELRIN